MSKEKAVEYAGNRRTMDQLIDSILTRNDKVPNFALLLGSGASVISGVKSAQGMIEEWRRELYRRSGAPESFTEWIGEQPWYNSDDEYSLLFELEYDQPPVRRAHIEECLKHARPTLGYMYLTNLLNDNIFNVVFTTNFDDLINEAFFLFQAGGVRPIVCAHDSAVSGIRVTSARPKIIKLHGDFLFDNIKNTMRELETLEDNMKRKFMQFAQEYGLVVVGYSGRDHSVMNMLDMLVQRGEYFQQGIYWCELERTKEGERTKRLRSLLLRDKVYLVKIPGFDEFMADICHRAGLSLPESVVNPLSMARDRARLFINVPSSVRNHEIISQDIQKVLQGISETPCLSERLPSSLRAAVVKEQKKEDLETALRSALDELRKAYGEDPNDPDVAYEMANILAKLHRKDELKKFVADSPIEGENKTYFLLHADDNQGAIAMADQVLSSLPSGRIARISSHITRINRAIALKRLGRIEEKEKELLIIENENPEADVRAGIASLRRKKKEMLLLLETALHESRLTVDDVETFVVFEDYREDKDLLKLLDKWRQSGLDKKRTT